MRDPAPADEPPIPTDAELGILRILWHEGPSTVREVLDSLPEERRVGYTTVLKLLQIMHDKGLVTRDESARTHVYRAAVAQRRTERRLVTDLVDRAFSGSVARMVMRALPEEAASPEEAAAIRSLILRLEAEERP